MSEEGSAETITTTKKRLGVSEGVRRRFSCGPEVLPVVVLVLCVLASCAMVAIVATTTQTMYGKLRETTTDTVERAAIDAGAHVSADLGAIVPIATALATVVGMALDTPRIPGDAERATYAESESVDTYGWNMTVMASREDRGGPSTVLYHAERWTDAEREQLFERLFWRTGGLGPEMYGATTSWGTRIVQLYCVTADGFSMLYPYYPQQDIYLDFSTIPVLADVAPDRNPDGLPAWSVPYADSNYFKFIVTVMVQLWHDVDGDGTVEYDGACGIDTFISDVVSYAEAVSRDMPWNAYVVICSSDGTILAIPRRGSADWYFGDGDPDSFVYADVAASPDYDPTLYNALSESGPYGDLGRAVGTSHSGNAEVSLPGGTRLVSWSFIDGPGWYAFAVIDRKRALSDSRHALVLGTATTASCGAVVAIASASLGVYVWIRRQYSRLRSRIKVLDAELDEARTVIAEIRDHRARDDDVVAANALSGGLRRVTDTLRSLASTSTAPSEQQGKILLEAIEMLTTQRGRIRLATELNDEQRQFVADCGMVLTTTTSSASSGGGTKKKSGKRSAEINDDASSVSSWHGTVRVMPIRDWFEVDVRPWAFDVFSFKAMVSGDRDEKDLLRSVAMCVAERWKLLDRELGGTGVGEQEDFERGRKSAVLCRISADKLSRFVAHVEGTYCNPICSNTEGTVVVMSDSEDGGSSEKGSGSEKTNPYHNATHAADVTQALSWMLDAATTDLPELDEVVTPLDRLACLLAAVCHDYGHPGLNGTFLRNTLDPLYVCHAGDSPLERHHIFQMFELLMYRDPSVRVLSHLTVDQRQRVHTVASKLILATDMARHVEILDEFRAWVAGYKSGDYKSGDRATTASAEGRTKRRPPLDERGKMLALQILMKAADLGNAFRPWIPCRRWTERLSEEFRNQGTTEVRNGLPVSKFMDGSISPAKMQDTFVPLIVIPLLLAIKEMFPSFGELEALAWSNLSEWRRLD